MLGVEGSNPFALTCGSSGNRGAIFFIHGMFRLKLNYLLFYAINGCLVPFIPLYLRQMELGDGEVGSVMAVSGLAVFFSPVLVTLIADTRLDARRVMGALLILAAASLMCIPLFSGFWAITVGFLIFNLLHVPVGPLQDGFTFSLQQRQLRAGSKPVGYHKIRVWGTIGFLIPGLLLYLLVKQWSVVTVVLYVAAGFALANGINALFLPRVPREQQILERRLPTAEAARVLFGRELRFLVIACFLLQMASASYYTFYPLYLSNEAGIPKSAAGMIMNIGVLIEIIFMLSFGRILRRFGERRFMLLGCAAMGLRMFLLAAFPNPACAVGIQAFHGMMVLVLHVGPIVIIDKLAGDRFRHSLQGLFMMLVVGGGRIVGNLAVGPIAAHGYQGAYWWATGLVMVAGLLLLLGYRPALLRESGGAAKVAAAA